MSKAERPTGGLVHRSGSCKSSEAYWMILTIKVAVVRAVSPTVRDSFQLKWKLMGCSFEQPFFYGGLHGAEASKLIYREYEIYPEPA